MINMSDINHIRDMAQSGYKISEISRGFRHMCEAKTYSSLINSNL